MIGEAISECYESAKRNEYFDAILHPIAELLKRKNADYGNSYDHLRNEFGDIAFIIRLGDKFSRLKSIERKGKTEVKDESYEDTIKDIIGYCTLELNYRRRQGR